jgi:hypothetical protein
LKKLLFITLTLISFGSFAQFGQSDSVMLLGGMRKLEPYQNTLKPDIGLDARRTFLQKQWIAVGGIRLGASYRRVHRMGIGIYFFNNRIFSRDFAFPVEAELIEYDFGYSALYYERVLFFNRKWEFAAGLQLGGGKVGVWYNPDGGNNRVLHTELPFSTAELAVYGDYNILYWLGIGAGLGYRGVSGLRGDISESFNGPVVVVNVKLKLVKLARSFFDPEVKYEY